MNLGNFDNVSFDGNLGGFDVDFIADYLDGTKPFEDVESFEAENRRSPNTFASVILHMGYGAAMRSDSVLNVKLNGKFISGVRLDNPKGDYYKGYRVDIPLSSFKQGLNRLSFEAELTPLHTDKCTLIQTENLRLTNFDDSTVSLPEVPYWIKMPAARPVFSGCLPHRALAGPA